ncbi:MAG: Npt1/Npt2 family nucleotide transporter [Pseudomonadota bacterium]|nr:Npt1/Npt2 family nucleotide transporter [Pseudomonadota bacterium]
MAESTSSKSSSLVCSLMQKAFPINRSEYGKFFPMAGLIFMTIFSFTMLRNSKDVLLLSAPGVSENSLPYAKFFLVFPVSIAFSMCYIKIKNLFDFEKTYYIILSAFISFYALFNCVLYPLSGYLHPSVTTIQYLQTLAPPLHNFIALFGVWTFALYYIASELWGTYSLSVLFWQFANDTISTEESKRYYSLLIMVGNLALMGLSYVLDLLSAHFKGDMLIYAVNTVVISSGLVMLVLFRYINRSVLTNPVYRSNSRAPKKKKAKMSLTDSVKELSQSRYVMYIALIVLSYGILINLFETVWKGQIKLFFTVDGVTDKNGMQSFMSRYTFYTGFFTILLTYVKIIMSKMSWRTAASITPIACGGCGLIFLTYCMNASTLNLSLAALGVINAGYFAIAFGAAGVIFSKSSKYAFFDPTKEMAYIPLSSSLKASGKAAVDGVGARLGKSGGGMLQIILQLMVCLVTGSPVTTSLPLLPYFFVIIGTLAVIWTYSVYQLSVEYEHKIAGLAQENDPTEKPSPDTEGKDKAAPVTG